MFRCKTMENLENLKSELLAEIAAVSDLKAWDECRVALIGKKGKITEQLKGLSALPLEQKIEAGKKLNVLKSEIEAALAARKDVLEVEELNKKFRVGFILFLKSMKKLLPFLVKWALRLPKGRILKINSITLTL